MPAEPLRVLINACTVAEQPTGIGVYALELSAALARREDCQMTFAGPEPAPAGAQRLNPPTTIAGPKFKFNAARLQVWTQTVLPIRMRQQGIDVYHGTEFAVPVFSRAPRVSTIHDLAFLTVPRLFPDRVTRAYFRAIVETARTATRIVVPSDHVANEVLREFGLPPSRVNITPLAGRSFMRPAIGEAVAETRQRLGLSRPYILSVGTWNRNKRVVDVLRAAAALAERGIDVDLALVGNPAAYMTSHYQREIARLGIGDRVHFLGHVADADLPALYSGALAFVFPSEYEGFGIPPLEAMACGTPVVVSDIAPLQGHCAGAAMVVPRRSPLVIADRLEEIIRSPVLRDEWIGRGLERASEYTWDRTAAATMAVYTEIT